MHLIQKHLFTKAPFLKLLWKLRSTKSKCKYILKHKHDDAAYSYGIAIEIKYEIVSDFSYLVENFYDQHTIDVHNGLVNILLAEQVMANETDLYKFLELWLEYKKINKSMRDHLSKISIKFA